MAKKLTITVSDQVYAALYNDVGRGRIAAFVERHLRPHLRLSDDLERAYGAYGEWLDSKEGRSEAADLDDWFASDSVLDAVTDEDRWPESWRVDEGPAEP